MLVVDERFKMAAEGNATEPLLKQALLAVLQSLFLVLDKLVHLDERGRNLGTNLPAGPTAEKHAILVQSRENAYDLGEPLPGFAQPQETSHGDQHELMLRYALVLGMPCSATCAWQLWVSIWSTAHIAMTLLSLLTITVSCF